MTDRATSRMLSLFQTLEKLNVQKNGPKMQPEDLQTLRHTIAMIQRYVATQEKANRDFILKSSTYLDLLLTTFEGCYDTGTQQNIVSIVNELIGKSNQAKRASTLVSHGWTHGLFAVLVSESKEEDCSEELLISIHQILSKLAFKDRKFGVKARLTNALGVTLSLLKHYTSSPKVLQSILPVVKAYSNNAVNASYLGKNGAVTYLYKVIHTCGRKYLILLKTALDSLSYLVKSKSNSARAIGQGGVPVMINLYYDWHKVDSKNRHINLRKAILTVLKNLTNLKSGRDSLKEAGGIRVLYTTCQESIESRELETLIYMASVIMRKCFPRNRLPLTSLRSSLTCPLPESDFHTIDMGEGQDTGTACSRELSPSPNMTSARTHAAISTSRGQLVTSHNHTGDENGYESSLDHDDDLSSDGDNDAMRADSDDDLERELRMQAAARRSWDDLMQYKKFFPEIYEDKFSTTDDDMCSDCRLLASTNGSRIISPAVHASHSVGALDTLRQSGGAQLRMSSNDTPRYLRDYSNISTSGRRRDVTGNGSVTDSGISSGSSLLRDQQIIRGYSRHGQRQMTQQQQPQQQINTSSQNNNTTELPVAVNIKTGTSVFTLDFPAARSGAGYDRPPTGKIPPKFRRRNTGTRLVQAAGGKDEKQLVSGRRIRSRTSLGSTKSQEDFSTDVSLSRSSRSSNSPSCSLTTDTTSQMTSHSSSMSTAGTLVSSRSDRPSFLLDSDDDTSNITDDEFVSKVHDIDTYVHIASKTVSVGKFNKIAFPEYNGHLPPAFKEPLYEKTFGTQRQKIFEDIDRFINADQTIDRVVYDLDDIVAQCGSSYNSSQSLHSNADELKAVKDEGVSSSLKFNAQFESGNLRKAIQVRELEYDLILNPDINTNHHHQWFYFQVSNMKAGVKYRFNIVNCEKLNSQFNFGMKPVMFSVMDALQGSPGWVRAGSEICYYKNHFVRSAQTTGGVRGKAYYTATFTLSFKYANDVCYLAYHYPYTYSLLQYHIYKWEEELDNTAIYFRNQVLTTTIGGNSVPVLTITAQPLSDDLEAIDQLRNRPYIFLTGRVHPGESNASWVMKGSIDYLLSDQPTAKALREQYIFKVVPMLNPDGVINGNHRCSLVAEDLNRRWIAPCPKLHPTIYHTKGLLQFLYAMQKSPVVYCDYHGHSRRKNVFLYGCSPALSWMPEDTDNPTIIGNRMEDTSYKTLPRTLQAMAPAFSIQNCSYMVEKSKEASARVVVWRQIRVVKAYTMESTYCGCDQGIYRGLHIGTRELEEMGRKFSEALSKIKSRHAKPATKITPSGSTGANLDIQPNTDGFSSSPGGLDSEGIAPAMEPLRIASDNTDTDDDDEEEESGLDEAAGYS